METPKKVVEADRCLICSTVVVKKEKLYIFGKSAIDFCEIIESALNVNVRNFSDREQLFICRAQCYQRRTSHASQDALREKLIEYRKLEGAQ